MSKRGRGLGKERLHGVWRRPPRGGHQAGLTGRGRWPCSLYSNKDFVPSVRLLAEGGGESREDVGAECPSPHGGPPVQGHAAVATNLLGTGNVGRRRGRRT